jgi:hypothetical protein
MWTCAVRTGGIVENLMAIEPREQHKSVGLKMEARASNVKNGNRFRFSGRTVF